MDLILHNANIITVDKKNPIVEAVAIKGSRISMVGSIRKILSFKDKNTKIIDLKGKTVIPGFNDSHMHILAYALSQEKMNLNNCKGIGHLIEMVKGFIEKNNIAKGNWVQGRGWNETFFEKKCLPSRHDLDKISSQYPMILTRVCGHLGVANTLALKIAGIYQDPPQLKSGSIDRDEKGIATGVLKENEALNIVYKLIPKITKGEVKKLLLKGQKECLKFGLTSLQSDDLRSANVDFKEILEAYFELDRQKKLLVRTNEQMRLDTLTDLKSFLETGYKTGDGSEFFKIGPLKLIADGSLGAKTAALCQDYEDDKGNKGILIYSQEKLNNLVKMAHTNNLQVAIHAIGDRAISQVIEVYQKVLKEHPKKDARFRIVHCQITTKDLIDKFRKYDIMADIQPVFVSTDLPIVELRMGKKRAKWTYNWKTLLDKDINVGAGSDCPVESFSPLLGIYSAVTRKDLQGYPEEGWLPEQKISIAQALYLFTMGSAYSSFEEELKGSISPGKLADMAVLSEDIFSIPADDIKEVKVEKTIVDGKILYES